MQKPKIKSKKKVRAKANTDASIYVAGVDEAGRGPLAGPVIAAAVILNPEKRIRNLADSKLLTAEQREQLYEKIIKQCLAWSVGRADVDEIDSINILRATLLAMRRAVLGLVLSPHHVKVDGNICPDVPFPVSAHVDGDQHIAEISAASIVAKVTRDREMVLLDKQFPKYGFAAHKGYSTPEHLQKLRQHGASAIHRLSFEPVRQVVFQLALPLEDVIEVV